MDKRFRPRTNDELRAAVQIFQARTKAMNERLKNKLEKEVPVEQFA